jgi:hypothetical protein
MGVTIQIPNELERRLDRIAASQQKTVEQLAVESLRSFVGKPMSPADLLRAIQDLPYPSREALDDLDAAIADSQVPA